MTGYALNMTSPICHVATEMDRAGGSALSISDLAASYQHTPLSDLSRVRQHEGCDTDAEATEWIIDRALDALDGQVMVVDRDRYRLRVPASELTYNGRPVNLIYDDSARLGDPFNPITGGAFTENIRIGKGTRSNPKEDDELRESMRQVGWLPGHPAVEDERGVVITGHRRLRIAAELKLAGQDIEPDILVVNFGRGDEGDIKRLQTAWFSNEGTKPYTKDDRAQMVAYLAARGWTQASIAEALSVSQATISSDLARRPLIISADNQAEAISEGKRKQNRGQGRPVTRKRQQPSAERQAEIDRAVATGLGQHKTQEQIASELGISRRSNPFTIAIDRATEPAHQPPSVSEPPRPEAPAPRVESVLDEVSTVRRSCEYCGDEHDCVLI